VGAAGREPHRAHLRHCLRRRHGRHAIRHALSRTAHG
jgi:hypothetical protein